MKTDRRTEEEIDALVNQAVAIDSGEEEGPMKVAQTIIAVIAWLDGANTRPL